MSIARVALALLAAAASLCALAQPLPTFPAKNVAETFFGTVVDDPYRALENVKDPDVVAWVKAHADHAQRTLESIPGYAKMRSRVAELDDAASAIVGTARQDAGGNVYFTRRGAKDNTLKLYFRDASGRESLFVDPDDWQKETGKPHAINYFAPSPDGRLVAFGISAAGSENASIYLIETATRKRIGTPIDRAQFPGINWRPDSRSFFFLRQQEMHSPSPRRALASPWGWSSPASSASYCFTRHRSKPWASPIRRG